MGSCFECFLWRRPSLHGKTSVCRGSHLLCRLTDRTHFTVVGSVFKDIRDCIDTGEVRSNHWPIGITPKNDISIAFCLKRTQIMQHKPVERDIIRQFRPCCPTSPSFRTASSSIIAVLASVPYIAPWVASKPGIPEIERAHNISRPEKLSADKAHHRIIIAASQRSVGVSYYCSSFYPAWSWCIIWLLEFAG